jgi:hypothetical protein
MKTKAKTFHIIVWSMLTLAGFNLLAAKEPLYDGLADQRHRKIFGPPKGFLNVYIAHNRHMLAYAAMMTGQRDLAMTHIRAMVAEMPADFLNENALQAEGNVAMPLEVMVRFGLWDEILAEPEKYSDKMWFTRAFHLGARAIAYAAKGDTVNARKAQRAFVERTRLVPKEDFVSNNSCEAPLAVAIPMVEGEILIAEGKIDGGIDNCAPRSKRKTPSNTMSRPDG